MVAGLALRIPPNVVSVANDAATFKPFDIRSAICELNPAQRGYASGQPATCGTMGRAILTIIAVLVTIDVGYYLGYKAASVTGKVRPAQMHPDTAGHALTA